MCTSRGGSDGQSPDGRRHLGQRRDVSDIRSYAAGLGLDAVLDQDLLWLAREALSRPLPNGWREHADDQGRVYFFKEATKESNWLHPADTVFRELVSIVKAVRAQRPAPPEAQRSAAVEEHLLAVHQRAETDLQSWSGPYESEAGEYYFNEALDVSCWSNPAEEWQIELDLRNRVLQRCLVDEWNGPVARAPSQDSYRTGRSSRASSPALSCRSGQSGRSLTPPAPRDRAEAEVPCKGMRPMLPEDAATPARGGADQRGCPDGGCHAPLDFETQIAAFARDPSRSSLELPTGMSPAERKKAKDLASQHSGLSCEAFGFGTERRLHLFRDSPSGSKDSHASPAGEETDENEQEITFGPSAAPLPTFCFETSTA